MSPYTKSTTTTILLHLILLTTTTISAVTATILDVDNQPVQPNTRYFMVPSLHGSGGGLTMQPKTTTMHCPLYVAQAMQEVDHGLPLKFLPVDPNSKLVSITSDLNIVFDATSNCGQKSTGWQLTLDTVAGQHYVAVGGEVGNPGPQTVNNWFKFEKAGSGKYEYKIAFCPNVCKYSCKLRCSDLGVNIDKDGKRWLGFSDKPLLVTFKKA